MPDRARCAATVREQDWYTALGYVAVGLFAAWVETPEGELHFGGEDDPKPLEEALAWARKHAVAVRVDVISETDSKWERYSAGEVPIDTLPPLPTGFTVARRPHPHNERVEPPLFPVPHPTLEGLGPTPFDDLPPDRFRGHS